MRSAQDLHIGDREWTRMARKSTPMGGTPTAIAPPPAASPTAPYHDAEWLLSMLGRSPDLSGVPIHLLAACRQLRLSTAGGDEIRKMTPEAQIEHNL